MRIAKGSWSWVTPPLVLSILFFMLSWYSIWFFVGFIPTCGILIFFLFFFRDPERKIAEGVIAPADGKIRDIKYENNQVFISTFMEVNNVHVNRMPLDGCITKMTHFPGYHLRAWKKESDLNERVLITIDTAIGEITVVQLAGLIARRVYPYIKEGEKLKKGDRIGIIRLGSRVDVYLPAETVQSVPVKIGDFVKAGENTIAFLKKY
jgi:phosphatidylserine decarboxylase